MWTAISNPLLLISHVLKRSMDLQQAVLDDTNVVDIEPPPATATSPLLPQQQHQQLSSPDSHIKATVNVCCEYVSIERHAEPTDRPVGSSAVATEAETRPADDWLNEMVDSIPR